MNKKYEKLVESMEKAVRNGDIGVIRRLLCEDSRLLNEMTLFGSWLHIAAENEQVEVVKCLIDAGIDINKNGDIEDHGAICNAVSAGNMEIVKILVENNALLDTSNATKNPLFDAIDSGNLEIVQFLVKNGIDISVEYDLSYGKIDAYKYSAIHGTKDITEYLVTKMKEKNIPILKNRQRKERVYDAGHKRNLEKTVLKELFAKAIRESVKEFSLRYKEETIYAMSFRMHYTDDMPKDRYLPEIIMQTKESYEEQWSNKERALYFKYIPEEYKYVDIGKGAFYELSEYLFQNCLNVEICKKLEDEEKQEEMEEAIIQENRKNIGRNSCRIKKRRYF